MQDRCCTPDLLYKRETEVYTRLAIKNIGVYSNAVCASMTA